MSVKELLRRWDDAYRISPGDCVAAIRMDLLTAVDSDLPELDAAFHAVCQGWFGRLPQLEAEVLRDERAADRDILQPLEEKLARVQESSRKRNDEVERPIQELVAKRERLNARKAELEQTLSQFECARERILQQADKDGIAREELEIGSDDDPHVSEDGL